MDTGKYRRYVMYMNNLNQKCVLFGFDKSMILTNDSFPSTECLKICGIIRTRENSEARYLIIQKVSGS